MKTKIFNILSIVFALILAVGLSLVPAVPAGASGETPYVNSLSIEVEPENTTAGQEIHAVVRARDQFGTVINDVDVTVSEVGHGYTFDSGTLTRTTAFGGIASFTDLVINTPGTGYQLHFTAGTDSVFVDSATFDVEAGPPPPALETSGTGIAEYSCHEFHSGESYSVALETGASTTGTDWARVLVPVGNKTLSQVASVSYWAKVTATEEPLLRYRPWAGIYLDDPVGGDGDPSTWEYYIQAEPMYAYPNGDPYWATALNTWEKWDSQDAGHPLRWTAYEVDPDLPYEAPLLEDYITGAAVNYMTSAHGVQQFATREYGSLTVIKIKFMAGYGTNWQNFIGYVDDIMIDGATYPLELPPARPLTVDDDRAQNPNAYFQRIQSAIDCAVDGETVQVYAGTYTENVYINKTLTLQAGSAPLLKGKITVENADNVIIAGFTIQPDSGTAVSITSKKSGHSGNVTVTGNTIIGKGPGGGVHGISYGGKAGGLPSTITGNTITNCDRGIYLDQGGITFTVTGNVVTNTRLAIGVGSKSGATTDNNTVNGSTEVGIEVFGSATIVNSTIINNLTGISVKPGAGDIFVNNCIISQNGEVTGIHLENVTSTVEITNSFIGGYWYWDEEEEEGVTYNGNAGNGIAIDYISPDGSVLIDNNKIVGNGGDGIYVPGESVYGELTITNNIIGAYDYDLTYENGDFFGGNGDNGILIDHVGVIDGARGNVTIQGNRIAQNTNDGIRFDGGATIHGDVTINNNLIGAWTDYATDEGIVYTQQYTGNGSKGISAYSIAPEGTLTITNNKIAENANRIFDDTGVYIASTSGDTTISNNYVGSWTQDIPGGEPVTYEGNGGPGILINNVPAGSLLIQGNNVSRNTSSGIVVTNMDGGMGAVTIDGNTVDDNGTGGYGIQLFGIYGATISGNTLTKHIADHGAYAGLYLQSSSYNDISGNTIKENEAGIVIDDSSHENIVRGNVIQNNAGDGIEIRGDGNKILGNDISNNTGIILCGIFLFSSAEGNIINYNNITSNTLGFSVGVYNDNFEEDVDARWNWWGDVNGPQADPEQTPDGGNVSTGDKVSNHVQYRPYLTEQWTNQVWVDDDWQIELSPPYAEDEDNDLYFATIQKAINTVPPGTTINVAAGEYEEELNIDKSLTVQGAGAETTFLTGIPDGPPFVVGIEIGWAGSEPPLAETVVFDGFTVYNEQFLIALSVNNGSSLTVSNNILNDCGAAIYCPGTTTLDGGSSVTIEDNEISYAEVGIYFDLITGGSELTVAGNEISYCYDGIGLYTVSGESTVAIQSNNIHDNDDGIYLDDVSEDSTVAITGNTIANNVQEESGIHLGEDVDATSVRANFNNITGNEDYGVYNDSDSDLNAKNNWWGSPDGPGEDGANDVSEDVDYEPWLSVPVIGGASGTVGAGETLDATRETGASVGVTSGGATVTVAKYSGDPGTGGGFGGSTNQYIDVQISDATPGTEIEIRLYYTDAEIVGLDEASLRLQWWDDNTSAWVEITPDEASGVNTTNILVPPPAGAPYSGFMWAKITATSTPSLADLTGTPFGGGGAAAAAGGGGGGGGGGGLTRPTLKGLVAAPTIGLDAEGAITLRCVVQTDDGKLTLDIAKGTRLLDSLRRPLTSLSAELEPSPPAPPSGAAIILAYDFGPNGVIFLPAITMTMEYDPTTFSEDIAEGGLYIAYWDGSKWVALTTTVNTMTRTASCQVSHLTTFALTGSITPPAPAAFSVSSLSVTPAEVKPEEAVAITVSVANTGGTEGSYSVALKVNGVTEAEESVTVAPGSSQSVSFSVTREEAGSYSVDVNGLSGSFTVAAAEVPPEAPIQIAWWIWVIAGVVVVGLIIFFLVRRRAY